jgi:NADH dehydrogenase/NADH:ubiquinone oxidoreductase subunit G
MEIRRIIIFLNDLICQEIRKCQDSDNEYLKAGCYQLYSDTVFNQTLILGIVFNPTSLFELKIPQNKLQDYYKEEFRTAFKLILIAYNTYTSLNLDKKAKDSIQLAHKLYRNAGFYKIDLADIVDITVFNKIVNHHNIDMLNYEIGQESNSDNKIEKQELSELLAKSFMKHHNMPPDRYQNVKLFTDIYLYLHDEDNNPKKGLGLSCNQNIHDSNSFVGKPYFLIHQNSIDKLIAEGSDVHEIIKNIENHISP